MIPEKYQIFDNVVLIPDKDVERLNSYLTGWNKLVGMLDGVNRYDLQRLVVLELMRKQRRPIINKLLVKLSKIDRDRVERRMTRCWKRN